LFLFLDSKTIIIIITTTTTTTTTTIIIIHHPFQKQLKFGCDNNEVGDDRNDDGKIIIIRR